MANQDLLAVLQAHGEQFLSSFSLPNIQSGSHKRKRLQDAISPRKLQKPDATNNVDDESGEEWGGIEPAFDTLDENDSDSESIGNFEHEDDEFTATSSYDSSKVVVFQDIYKNSTKTDPAMKLQMKAFMSSKVSKLREHVSATSNKDKAEEDNDDERTNAQNDAMLHHLVHTKLLSGSLDPDLDMTPAQRRKALAGRVLELSGTAKLGKGEKSVREMERNKASMRVREGLKAKQKARAKQELEQAKDLGNYHPTLKKLFEDTEGASTKKRERGLRMGVGKFRGGLLQLGRDDLQKVEVANRGGRGQSRGTLRGRGRGRGR